MKLKLYALTAILTSGIVFSQIKKNDTLPCGGRLEDPVVNKIVDAYGNKPEKPKKTFTKNRYAYCGTELMKEFEKTVCDHAKTVLKDYPFLVDEMKKLAKDHSDYLKSDLFWMDRKKDTKDKSLQRYREEALKKWMLKGNHSYFSMVIISDITDDRYEKITLTVRLPKQVITKHYKLLSKT
ncbi:hypothetical protein EGY05_07790 [Chryseobacterium arthrosphaerae]|uniref:hypothetical protein n=1 Tax=Chryseobacterium arthrosphaerae TaxID=651561 RepID=UPI000F4E31ED|nr:hypothetical protein [Chryseobacterium arthrosphaerae]AYZ11828.1 hypothetical protein EGY05_07790 [Chryseobacterium arthrosphaerae]